MVLICRQNDKKITHKICYIIYVSCLMDSTHLGLVFWATCRKFRRIIKWLLDQRKIRKCKWGLWKLIFFFFSFFFCHHAIGKCQSHVDVESSMDFMHQNPITHKLTFWMLKNNKWVNEIVDHKLWHSKSARTVRKMSNRNQTTRPRHMTTVYWIMCVTQFYETFSTPHEKGQWGWGTTLGGSSSMGRSTIASGSQCTFFVYTKTPTCNYAREFFFLHFQMLIQWNKYREKPRFWNKSRTLLAFE